MSGNQSVNFKLLSCLSLRGHREIDLHENISFLKDIYASKMEKLVDRAERSNFLLKHLDMSQQLEDYPMEREKVEVEKEDIEEEDEEVEEDEGTEDASEEEENVENGFSP